MALWDNNTREGPLMPSLLYENHLFAGGYTLGDAFERFPNGKYVNRHKCFFLPMH